MKRLNNWEKERYGDQKRQRNERMKMAVRKK
jgi:hypothetical protein